MKEVAVTADLAANKAVSSSEEACLRPPFDCGDSPANVLRVPSIKPVIAFYLATHFLFVHRPMAMRLVRILAR